MSEAAHPKASTCANCGTVLAGRWCHGCGQRDDAHHNSIRHLARETMEGLTELDGRVWRTLRLLVIHPARLTRDYLDGHRMAEVPPLRLYLITLVTVFAVASLTGRSNTVTFDQHDLAQLHAGIDSFALPGRPGLTAWLHTHLIRAVNDPREVAARMHEWAERFAVLLAPLVALCLWLLYPRRRDGGLFAHSVFACHSLSFAALLWAATEAAGVLGRHALLVIAPALIAAPIHLFAHLRGVYGRGTAGTLWRLPILAVLTLGVFLLLISGLSAVTIGGLPG